MNAPATTLECSVDGCTDPARLQGWCRIHHGRWRRTGDPTALRSSPKLDETTVAELRRKVGIPPEGPTPEMVTAWREEESLPDSDDLPDQPAPVLDEQPATLEDRLRAEITTVRDAFEILLRDRDHLARQVEMLSAQLADEHREALRAIGALEATRRERDTWEAEYERVRDDKLVELTEALEDRDRLAGLLEEAAPRVIAMRAEVERVVAIADQLVAEARRHRHAWDWQPGLKALPLPCSCGLSWPRNRTPGGR